LRLTIHIIVVVAILLFASCTNQALKSIDSRDLSFMYKPGTVSFHPEFSVYHNSDTSTLLFVKLFPREFATAFDDEYGKQYFKVKFHYRIYKEPDTEKLKDSASVAIKSYQTQMTEDYVTYIPLSLKRKNSYTLEIISTDLISEKRSQHFIRVEKENSYSSQNFLITNADSKKPIFEYTVKNGTSFLLKNQRNATSKLFVKYYEAEIPAPMPPYYISTSKVLEINPDSLWEIQNYSQKEFALNKEGIYYFQTDSMADDGIALYKFNNYYPEIKTEMALLNPLIYLTSFREYKKLESYKNQKIAVDSFWINTANDINKARELIRIYYNRVKLANKYFTSYTEGWNTDRGMIFIVLGPPRNVYRSDDMEKWSYGHRTKYPVLEFTFINNENPFTDNSYALQRDELYSQIWNQAVDTWRSGRVFSIAQ